MATLTREEILARRKKAATASAKTGRVPTNGPARVDPASSRPKVQPLGRKSQTATVSDDGDDDAFGPGDVIEAKVVAGVSRKRKLTKEERRAERRKAAKQEASTVSNTAKSAPTTRAIAPRGLVDPTREITTMDMVIPRLKISQAMSKVNTEGQVPQGNWYRSPANKTMGKELLVVIVDMQKSRSYFVQGEGIICRSYDMVKGEGDPGLACEGTPEEQNDPTLAADERGCPLRIWKPRNDGTNYSDPPDCGVNFNYKLLILDKNDPHEGGTMRGFWTLRSTATRVAKQINTILQESEGSWESMILKLTIQSTSNRKGTYFIPSVEYFGQTQGLTKRKAEKFRQQMVGVSIRATLEADYEDS